MRLLLDTHAFLWWIGDDPQLSARARELLADGGNEVLFSAASAWEIAIKASKGLLSFGTGLEDFVVDQVTRNGFQVLPVRIDHALRVARLPLHHRDPFDRLLVAQAQVEGLPLVTRDPALVVYEIETVW